jgi:hypothetical protein
MTEQSSTNQVNNLVSDLLETNWYLPLPTYLQRLGIFGLYGAVQIKLLTYLLTYLKCINV